MTYHFEFEVHTYLVVARAMVDGRYTAGEGRNKDEALQDLIRKQAFRLREYEIAVDAMKAVKGA